LHHRSPDDPFTQRRPTASSNAGLNAEISFGFAEPITESFPCPIQSARGRRTPRRSANFENHASTRQRLGLRRPSAAFFLERVTTSPSNLLIHDCPYYFAPASPRRPIWRWLWPLVPLPRRTCESHHVNNSPSFRPPRDSAVASHRWRSGVSAERRVLSSSSFFQTAAFSRKPLR
jgi:hypothetical protein